MVLFIFFNMIKKEIKCPHCNDTWEYEMIVEHSCNKCVVTKDFNFIEDEQDCVCYKCHNHYTMKITSSADIKMDDFVYNAWRHCKM